MSERPVFNGEKQRYNSPSPHENGGLKSKYVYRADGIPTDPATIKALEEWADAWGDCAWQCKIEGVVLPNEEDASDELKAKGHLLEKKLEVIAKLIPGATFSDRVVLWKDGHVQLGINS